MVPPKPAILCILDGWGLRRERKANAVALADTPTYDRLMATCPNATLRTSGIDVGLPAGQMGNSEVGHTNIGAGRIVQMALGRIDGAIDDGSFAANPELAGFTTALKESGGRAHLLGIASDGGVHGHIDHMLAATKAIAGTGIEVCIHAITDGRDAAPGTAADFLCALQNTLPHAARIATVSGRYYALDRDNRWDRVARAYDAIARGRGVTVSSAKMAVETAAYQGDTDEFILPSVIDGYGGIRDGDGVFCLNFRADRAREIMAALSAPGFDAFDVSDRARLGGIARMADYADGLDDAANVLFPGQPIENTLGHWVAKSGLRQFRLAETEKYPHVTYFLNGGAELPEQGEERSMPPSPKVATYDLQPEMAADAVTTRLVGAIAEGFDLIVVNFANPDMVGHTGDLAAAIFACQTVDQALARVVPALQEAGGVMLLTADHGNCETMVDPATGKPHTAHTTNPVPVVLVGAGEVSALCTDGRLADIAPTLIDLMGLPKPPQMTGKSLLIRA